MVITKMFLSLVVVDNKVFNVVADIFVHEGDIAKDDNVVLMLAFLMFMFPLFFAFNHPLILVSSEIAES